MRVTVVDMKAKKILIVSHYYPPHIGGIETIAYNQAKRLKAQGHNVTVVTSQVAKNEKNETKDGIRIIRIKAWNGLEKRGIPYPIFSPRLVVTIAREVKRSDVIHVHDALYISSFIAAWWSKRYRRPLLLTQHVALVPHPSKMAIIIQKIMYRTTGRYAFHSSQRITVLNDAVKQLLLKIGVPESKINWLPNGVDDTLFRPGTVSEKKSLRKKYNLNQSGVVVLFVGRFVYKKGYFKVTKAESPEYHLLFVGGHTQAKNSEGSTYLGKRSHDELAEIYRLADIFILPSEGEGFPVSVQEAMASGLAIVMADSPGYTKYKLSSRYIKLLHQSSSDSIKNNLELLAENIKLRHDMEAYSYTYAKKHFSWNQIIRELDSMYDAIMIENRISS